METNTLDKIFSDYRAKFEELRLKAEASKDYDTCFSCLQVCMGIDSNIEENRLREEAEQERLKKQEEARLQQAEYNKAKEEALKEETSEEEVLEGEAVSEDKTEE